MTMRLLSLFLATAFGLASPLMAAETDKQDFSAAERLLLMTDQLQALKPATTLNYAFAHRGTLDEAFQDKVSVSVARKPDGQCCAASGTFLSGQRRLALPAVDDAKGNPVILYFLERDIREMNRLTKGSMSYFRKRIRMALYESATLRDISTTYQGRTVPAREISIQPYLNDPNHARFEEYTAKRYVFVLSDAVPGHVVSIRASTPARDGNKLLIEEELIIDDAAPTIRQGAH